MVASVVDFAAKATFLVNKLDINGYCYPLLRLQGFVLNLFIY